MNEATHIILVQIHNAEQFITISRAKKDGKNLKAIMKILKNVIENNFWTAMMTIGSRQIAYNGRKIGEVGDLEKLSLKFITNV